MGGGGSKHDVNKDTVSHFSTIPKVVGKKCNKAGCWEIYGVKDMKKVITNDKDIRTTTTTVLDYATAPFINNIIGIASNLHVDLEGSTLSLNDESLTEGFKEGGPGLTAAAVRKVSLEARNANNQIEDITRGVENNGRKARPIIQNNVDKTETSKSIAAAAAEAAAVAAAAADRKTKAAEEQAAAAANHAYIAEQKMNRAKEDQEDTAQSLELTSGDHKDVQKLRTSSEKLFTDIQNDHTITSASSEDAQATAEHANLILKDIITEKQKQAATNVLAMPDFDSGMGSAVLSGESRQSKIDGEKITNIHKTLGKMVVGSDVPESFIPGRKNKMEPFSLLEGFKEGNTNRYGVDATGFTRDDLSTAMANVVRVAHNQQANHEQQSILSARNREARAKHLSSELMQQRRNIAGEIFTDYLTTDKSTNVNDVYQRKKQDNIKKERLVQTRQYEMKIYNEYINIGKILVIAFVLFVLAKVLNNKGIIGDSLTELFIALIIIITIIYLIWRLVWLGLRDPIDFDKTNQGYDRQYVKNMKGNKYPPKKYNLGFLTGTCSGNDCCSNGMEYDSVANKCIVRADDTGTDAATDAEETPAAG